MDIKQIKLRKSAIEHIFYLMAIIFATGLTLVILSQIWGDLKDPLTDALDSAIPDNSTTFNVSENLNKVDNTIVNIDKVMPILLVGLVILVLMGIGIYAQSPIMIFVAVMVLAVALLLAGIFTNIYEGITTSSTFSTTAGEFSITNKLMDNLPFIVIIVGVAMGGIILWIRKGEGGADL